MTSLMNHYDISVLLNIMAFIPSAESAKGGLHSVHDIIRSTHLMILVRLRARVLRWSAREGEGGGFC